MNRESAAHLPPVPDDVAGLTAVVRDFAESVIVPHAAAWEEARCVPREVFREAGRRGLLGLKYAGEYGGAARPYAHTVAYLETLARSGAWGTVLSLVIHSEMATPLLHLCGSDDVKRRWLAPAIGGDVITAIAMTEPEGGSDLGALRTTARRVAGGVVVNGRKFMTGNGSTADVVCVICAAGERRGWIPRLTAVLVPRDTSGFRVVRRLEKIGLHATDNCELAFEDCWVPEACVVGPPGGAGVHLARSNAYERLALAVCALGAMERLWEHARDFARDRRVFGKAVLEHQVWRHRLVEDLTRIEATRRLVDAAASTMDAGRPDLRLVAMAKLFATESLQRVAYATSQVFGARGFLRDELAARGFVDARALTIGGGTSEVQKELLADLVL